MDFEVFEVDNFIETMHRGNLTQRSQALNYFFNFKLTTQEKETLFQQVQAQANVITPFTDNYREYRFLLALLHNEGCGCQIAPQTALFYLKEAMDLGDPLAMTYRGIMHEQGNEKNVDQAIECYHRAADVDEGMAKYRLGLIHELGLNGEVNYEEASKFYEQAIFLGSSAAMVKRAAMHEKAVGGPANPQLAIHLLEKACLQDDSIALNNLGRLCERGLGGQGKPDYASAIDYYRRAISFKRTSAMENLASMYKKGRVDNTPNYEAAAALYDQAIALGCTSSMCKRALMHIRGLCGRVDYVAARQLYEQAAQTGKTSALNNLAIMYQNKQANGHADYTYANLILDKAVALGDEVAMFNRGRAYIKGQGIPTKNYLVGMKLLEDAIKKGHVPSMAYLGNIYLTGESGKKDYDEAARLFDKAMHLDNLDAMEERAKMHLNGLGGPVSPVKYRLLQVLLKNQGRHFKDDDRKRSSENTGFYHLLTGANNKEITEASINALAEALKFLKTFPVSPKITELKQRIITALGEKIIPKYPILENFHDKVKGLNAYSFVNLIYLIREHAQASYNEQGKKCVNDVLLYEAFAKDPKALSSLKILASSFIGANYWLGLSLLNRNQKAGLFTASDRQKAIECFKLAAADYNIDLIAKDLARKKLAELGIKVKGIPEIQVAAKPHLPRFFVPAPSAPSIQIHDSAKKEPDHSQYVDCNEPQASVQAANPTTYQPIILEPVRENAAVVIEEPPSYQWPVTPRYQPTAPIDAFEFESYADAKTAERVPLLS